MPLDQRVIEIVDAAVARVVPQQEDIEYLLGFDGYSAEAAYVQARAREIAQVTSEGMATIHAQIGVDAHPCPMNCQYCAFAQVNAGVCEDIPELPLSVIQQKARLFDQNNVHLISLMSTAGLPFARYLEMVTAVRQVVSDDMIIMANTRDMSLTEAFALKEAGANAVYHALRLGEGVFTAISPDRRRQTINHIHQAGLALMTGVEPVWEGASKHELAARLCEIPSFEPFCTGACGLHSTEGTVLADQGFCTPRTGFVRYIGALSRLICGYQVRFGGVGGAIWVDAGTDPRKRQQADADEVLIKNISRARRTLEQDGWVVPERPSLDWLQLQ